MVSLPAPGFPLLAVFGLPQALTSFTFSKRKTGPPLLRGVAGCATGSARLLGAHLYEGGLRSLYFVVPFPCPLQLR